MLHYIVTLYIQYEYQN